MTAARPVAGRSDTIELMMIGKRAEEDHEEHARTRSQ